MKRKVSELSEESSRQGHLDNSPAIYRWVRRLPLHLSPVGTAELTIPVVPTGQEYLSSFVPSDESLVYRRSVPAGTFTKELSIVVRSVSALLLVCVATIVCDAQTIDRVGSATVAAPSSDVAAPRYKLLPGDVFEVQYRYSPEFNQTVTVQPDGHVTLEIGGDLVVSGLTLEQLRKLIYTEANERLNEPDVLVILKDFHRPFFVVAGQVAQPGRFEMREPVTAFQAVMLAGGFKEGANSAQVLVYRRVDDETAEVKVVDLKRLKKIATARGDLPLEAGDMLFVPADKLSKIERYARIASVGGIFGQLLIR